MTNLRACAGFSPTKHLHGVSRTVSWILPAFLLFTSGIRADELVADGLRLLPVIADSTTNVGLRNVTVVGRWGYCSIETGLLVLDLSDPSAPGFVTRLDLGSPRPPQITGHFRVEVQGRYAYMPHWAEGFYVIDISDPGAPWIAGHLAVPDRVRAIMPNGAYAYLACADQPLFTVDISDPAQPSMVDSALDNLLIYDFCMAGSNLYAAGHFLYTFDLSDPSHPIPVHTYTETAWAFSVTVQGARLYVTDILWLASGGLQGIGIFDLSSPHTPVLLGTNPQHVMDNDVVPVGNYAYLTHDNAGLHAADISDPEHPFYYKCYDAGAPPDCGDNYEGPYGTAMSVAVVDGYAYVSSQQGMLIYTLDRRGDINADAQRNAADIILLVNYVFKSGAPPDPLEQGDTECLGGITSADIIYLVNFVFKSASPPVCP